MIDSCQSVRLCDRSITPYDGNAIKWMEYSRNGKTKRHVTTVRAGKGRQFYRSFSVALWSILGHAWNGGQQSAEGCRQGTYYLGNLGLSARYIGWEHLLRAASSSISRWLPQRFYFESKRDDGRMERQCREQFGVKFRTTWQPVNFSCRFWKNALGNRRMTIKLWPFFYRETKERAMCAIVKSIWS